MIANRLLPIIAGLVVTLLVFVGVKSCDSDSQDNARLSEVPVAGTPDADSPADTIRTLTAEVAAIKSESEKLQIQNQALLRQRNDIESRVKAQLSQEIAKEQHDTESSAIDKLTRQLDFFKTRLDELNDAQNQAATSTPGGLGDIPIGFGIGEREGLMTQSATQTIVWVEQLGTETDPKGLPAFPRATDDLSKSGGLLQAGQRAGSDTEHYLKASTEALAEQETPVYTVPRNSTLIGSTGMTALIGRIPIDGAIEDPFPFKAIVGRDNLAANGIEMPGLDGMIFSGKASGDWTLSCVRGYLTSVTYVFAGGTIRTLSSDDNSLLNQNQNRSSSQTGREPTLGWISDRRGIPCVTGTRISNAASFLTGRILAAATEAAAGAFAQNQVTNTVSASQGVTTSIVTGDAAQFAGGRALAGGASEVSDYLRERAAQAFDVVYVDTGSELAIHVDIELPIDYEPNGRKTTYAFNEQDDSDDLD